MARRITLIALILAAALGAGEVLAAKPAGAPIVQLDIPAAVDGQTTVAVSLSLPRGTAAIDGRLLLDKSGAEVVGLAPVGGGVALMPHEIPGGYAFGAYGLSSKGGKTTVRIVLNPLTSGQLGMTVVIDAAADAAGRRLTLTTNSASGALKIGKGAKKSAAPAKTSKPGPKRAAGPARDLVADGILGKLDLDIVRAGWELARINGAACGTGDLSADANGDGCVDIVDIQAVVAAQGKTFATGRKAKTSDASSGSTAANAVDLRYTASIGDVTQSAPSARSAAGLTFVVNSAADTPDATNGDGLCADASGMCTLRAAITESNWQSGPNTINFNLPGSAPVPIQYTSGAMSQIQDRSGGLTIDGYSQPGSQVNTASVGSNAIPGVMLLGTSDSPRGIALRITSSDNVIRGLQLQGFYRGIFIDGADAHDNVIVGNFMGYQANGGLASYAGYGNVILNSGAHHNRIGATSPADRNVIGRTQKAIYLYGPGTDSNIIQNNVMCITPDGFGAARCAIGVDTDFGPKRNLIGGSSASERNVIGPTGRQGIEISHGWDPSGVDTSDKWQNNENRVVGNWVGFRGNGSYDAAFRSGQDNPGGGDNGNGINVHDGSNNNVVEGNYVAAVWDGIQTMSPNSSGNVIRANIVGESPLGQAAPLTRDGIVARINTRSAIIEANIVRNAGRYGIGLTQKDVLWVRVSQNIITDMSGPAIFFAVDPGDSTKGADDLIAPPLITSATTNAVYGTGIAGATVELYRASRSAGESGLPVAYLGSVVVPANGSWILPAVLEVGDRAAALQILPNNNTSRLSLNVSATFEQPPNPPVANFSHGQQAGTLEIDFQDTSTGSPAAWSWNFGDGIGSNAQNPSHTYAVGGEYTVVLTATNAGGSSTVTKTVNVETPDMAFVVANDSFSRTTGNGWGTAEVGGAYSHVGTLASFSVANGVGSMTLPAGGASRSALLNGVSQRNMDIRFRVATNKPATGGKIFVYGVARRTGNSEYRPRMILNPDGTVSVHASQFVNGGESPLGKPVVVNGLTVTPGSFIWFRAQVTGANPTTVRVKVWSDGQQEPSSWHFITTSSQAALQGVGGAGLRTYLESSVTNAPVTITFDDYSVTSTASSTSVATDAFARTRSSSWGGADMGGLWRLIGSASSFNVANGVGTIDLPAAGASRGAMLDDVNQMSVDIRFRVAVSKVPASNNLIVYAVARRNTNNEYRPRIMFQPDGTIRVGASALVGGKETMLGTPVILSGFKPAAGSFVWVHAQVTGASPTTIRVKAWADGQSEPAAWQYSATSSHAAVQVAGSVGLRAYLSAKVGNAPIRVTFDDYSVSTAQ